VQDYDVSGHEKFFLGLPQLKVTLLASLKLGSRFTFNPSAIHTGKRFGYQDNGATLSAFPAATLLNIHLDYRLGDWNLGLGLMNATDRKVPFLQPYNAYASPLPGARREAFLRIGYRM
jgi:hypothetical protein